MKRPKTHKADILGITASLTCAVHCSILPLGIAYGMLGSSFMIGHGFVESIFIVLSIGLASYALYGSYRSNHGNPLPLSLFFLGLALILVGVINHGNWEIIMATSGGFLIAVAHFYNIRINSCQIKNA